MSTKRKPQSRNPAAPAGQRPGGARGGSTASGARTDGAGTGDVAPVSGATKAAAVGLWGVVGIGLAYGISQTAVKVVALFS